ncbi:hydroxyacid dehydrogenase [Acuticoccus sp.]|uniref:hydroxyacid dehydrogenase n=1 Tax=Acuticoccus sp. TaxID=1904378 RepID=UPI003B51C980
MDTVLVLKSLRAEGLALLQQRPGTSVVVIDAPTPQGVLDAIASADALLVKNTPITPAMVDAAERLKVVSKHGVGLDNLPVEHLTSRGVPVTTVGDANSGAVAEHALMLMLALSRRLPQYDARTRAGGYITDPDWPTHELAGRRLLVIGAGRIGLRVARLARAFGMAVAAHDPDARDEDLAALRIEPAADLHAALGAADIVSLHCPLTEATRRLMDASRLAAMRPGALLINTGRGGLVDEAALLVALREGRISGAGLDVFEVEPPDPTNPLFAERGVIVTPHTAALTEETSIRMARVAAQNCLAGLEGRLAADMVVNPEVLLRHAVRA